MLATHQRSLSFCYHPMALVMQPKICVDFLPQSNYPHFFTFLQVRSMSNSFYMKKQTPTFSALILAGGHGSRMKAEVPKQYQSIKEHAIIWYSLQKFLTHPCLNSIHVVIDPAHYDLYINAIEDLELPSPIHGGATRMESCYNGLKAIDLPANEMILIHDAARPCITHDDINKLLNALEEYPSVTLGQPISETLRRAENEQILSDTIDRANAWSIQTPQGFRFGFLKQAHENAYGKDGFTDDCSVMEANGHQTSIVKGSRHNIKITWPEDMKECETYMQNFNTPLIGQGFDVHAFGNEQAEYIRLGGIDIPHTHPLTAHSDGDVVLHALTDALLGAIAEGDIGQHFPPSDMQWKDKDSAFFLLEACKMIKNKQCSINNVDITIMCEAPKIGPYRNAMKVRIASLLELPEHRVNIKATTTEKLGFTGRQEGIAVQATALITEHHNE